VGPPGLCATSHDEAQKSGLATPMRYAIPAICGQGVRGPGVSSRIVASLAPERRVSDQGVRERGTQVVGANLAASPWEAQALSALARQLTP
jgi:hypothetical protein